METVSPRSAFHSRVSCTTRPPASTSAAWRATSCWMARATLRKEFRFLISARVPSSAAPRGRMETLASQRSEPCSMLQSETRAYISTAFNAVR